MLDHDYIQDHQVVDRYLMGKLAAEEKADFENHFLDCGQCLDELEISAGFQRDLKEIAAEDFVRSFQTGVIARFMQHRLMRLISVAMVPVGVVALTLAMSFHLQLSQIRAPQTPLSANLENYRGPSGDLANQWVFAPSTEFVSLKQTVPVPSGKAQLTVVQKSGKEVYRNTVPIADGSTQELLLHRSLFRNGEYRLIVEVLDDPNHQHPLEYEFSVLKQ